MRPFFASQGIRDNWPATRAPAAPRTRFHRARLGGATTGQLPPERPPQHASTEPVSVGRQLASYQSAPPQHASTEPVSVGRQLASYQSAPPQHASTEPVSVGRQLASYQSAPPQHASTEPVSVGRQLARNQSRRAATRFHRARLGGTTTGPLPERLRPNTFPPSPSRWDDNWPATRAPLPLHVSTEPVSVGRQLARYLMPRPNTFPPSPSRWDDNWPATARRASMGFAFDSSASPSAHSRSEIDFSKRTD